MMHRQDKPEQTLIYDAAALVEGDRAAARAPRLVVVEGPMLGQMFALDPNLTRIGRRDGSECVLDSPVVSRNHATIVHEGERYCVMDVGAANGVFINGKKLTPRSKQRLSHGDSLVLGNVRLLFLDPYSVVRTISSSDVIDDGRQGAEVDSWMKRVYAIDPFAEDDCPR